ncbi:MAG TPA: ATP synthase F0 subunit B [Chthonomonadales bacterium]|nr:ATP synthase F0 subunit B [Chthonomonadales bacterium]
MDLPILSAPFGPWFIENAASILAIVVGFALFALLVAYVHIPVISVPALRKVLMEREVRISTAHKQVESALQEALHAKSDYANRIHGIEDEARARIGQAVQEADVAREQIIADARDSALAVRRRAEEEIARARTEAGIRMRRLVVRMALDAADEAVRQRADDTVQRQLIKDFNQRVAVAAHSSRRA